MSSTAKEMEQGRSRFSNFKFDEGPNRVREFKVAKAILKQIQPSLKMLVSRTRNEIRESEFKTEWTLLEIGDFASAICVLRKRKQNRMD